MFFLNTLLKSALWLSLNVRHKSECSSLLFEKTLIQALTGISPSAVMLCFSIHIYANNPIGSVILFYLMFLCFCPHSFRIFWGTKAISPTSKSRRIVWMSKMYYTVKKNKKNPQALNIFYKGLTKMTCFFETLRLNWNVLLLWYMYYV